MTNQGNLKILGNLENAEKGQIAREFAEMLVQKYPDIEAELYLGYPIYIDEVADRRVSVDMALISKMGVYIINILTSPVTDYGMIQDDIYAKVETKFKKQPFLFKKRTLVFNFFAITYSTVDIKESDGYPLVNSLDALFAFIEENRALEEYSDDLFGKILSGIQEAYGINIHRDRGNVSEGTKAYAIDQMSSLIEKYDTRQMEAILSDTIGIQRIRGMAGSGKTIVLARKAVELHTAHPDWDIVVTYSTRTLKDQLISLISRFYAAKNDGAKYNDTKLKVMQSWGSARSKGVYYEVCLRHGIEPMNVTEAKGTFRTQEGLFSKVCGELLSSVENFHKMYDCILIDEAQDFDKNYLQLCLKILDSNKRLVYAKNRQSLSNMQLIKNLTEGGDDALAGNKLSLKYAFNIHTAGAATPEDFFRDDSVVYTSVRRAKGNETFMVYIVNAQKCVNSLRRRSDRNALFTAITRSKGWVRVLGYGEDMDALNREFEEIKAHDFKLHFDEYPDKEKQKQIFLNNRDIAQKDVKILDSTKLLIGKLTTGDKVSKLQLMQELFGMSREELLKELSKKSGDE